MKNKMARTIKPHLLIVGGTGFLGHHLALKAKKKSWRVSSISLHKPKKNRKVDGVSYFKSDVTNLKQLKKKIKKSFTHVVNLSGYANHSIFKNKRKSTIKNYFLGLVNLTIALSKVKIKSFVQIGSSGEYGNIKAPQNENSNCLPNSLYATAKLASTQFLLMLYNAQNFPVTVLRFFQVYGPRQDQKSFLPQIIIGCLKDKSFAVSKGEQVRDFCYVDDAINAIFLALASKKTKGEVFNIGLGKPITLKQAVNHICKIIKKGKPKFGEIKYKKNENMKIYPNIKKASIRLKWKPKIDFSKGIKIVINSYRKNER